MKQQTEQGVGLLYIAYALYCIINGMKTVHRYGIACWQKIGVFDRIARKLLGRVRSGSGLGTLTASMVR